MFRGEMSDTLLECLKFFCAAGTLFIAFMADRRSIKNQKQIEKLTEKLRDSD
jgi:hypothetical protein